MKGEGLSELQQSISKRLSVLHGLKGAVSGSMQNRSAVSDMDVFAEYVRMVTLHEILNYNKSIRLISANKESCREICEEVAELDVAIAVLSFQKSLPFYSKPHYIQNMQLNLQELYHHPHIQYLYPESQVHMFHHHVHKQEHLIHHLYEV